MSLRSALRDVFVGDESRGMGTLENPSTDLAEALSLGAYEYGGPDGGLYIGPGGTTHAGKRITPARALAIAAVFACVKVLAEDTGTMPLYCFESALEPRGVGGAEIRVRRRLHPEDDERAFMLGEEPNPELAAQTKWEITVGHMLLWGNAYDFKEIDRTTGEVRALWPLGPHCTAPFRRADGSRVFLTQNPFTGEAWVLLEDEVIHYRAFGTGDVGISPIGSLRQAWGLAIAAEEYAGRFWSQGGRAGGALTTEKPISDPDYERALRRWNNRHQGLDRSHLVALLDNGMKWQDIGLPPGDAQFIETRKFQVREAARAFRVPPYKIADLEAGAVSYASVEAQQIDYLTSGLQPWPVRIEQGLKRGVFGSSRDRARGISCRFQRTALLQGDELTRYKVYDLASKNRIMLPNEAREREDLPPIEGGWEFPPVPSVNAANDPATPIDADAGELEDAAELHEGASDSDG